MQLQDDEYRALFTRKARKKITPIGAVTGAAVSGRRGRLRGFSGLNRVVRVVRVVRLGRESRPGRGIGGVVRSLGAADDRMWQAGCLDLVSVSKTRADTGGIKQQSV